MRARGMAVVAASLLASVLVGVPPARAEEPAAGVRYVDRIFTDVGVVQDVPYGAAVNSRGETQELLLDVYHPVGDEETDRGLVIWAHGSGFRVGDKSDIGPLKEYVKRGWIGISISYRMRPELPPNAFVGIVTDPTSVPTAQAAAMDAHARLAGRRALVAGQRRPAGHRPRPHRRGGHVRRGDHGADGRLQRGRPRYERHPR